jgi:hypothetical protein
MMAQRRIRAAGGLATDASALDNPEAMRVAENVVLHRPGLVLPRPGFGDTSGIQGRTAGWTVIDVASFDGELFTYETDHDNLYRWQNAGNSGAGSYSVADASPVNQDVRVRPGVVLARGNMYVTSGGGMQKITEGLGGGTFYRAGVWMTYQPVSTGSVSTGGASTDLAAVDADSSVAYRWCVKRTDESGYTARSAPSSRVVVRVPAATFANGAYVTLGSLYLPDEALAGDVIEFYRTVNTGNLTADPGEDFFLCGTYSVTSSDITAGFIGGSAVTDNVLDRNLGAALYTSASQLGASAAKELPPMGHDLAQWRNVTWMAGTEERKSLTFWINKVAFDDGSTTKLWSVGLTCCDNLTYAGVVGNTINGVTFQAGTAMTLTNHPFAVGQWIGETNPYSTSGRIAVGSKIVSFDTGAATITLDTTPSGSGSLAVGDVITITGDGDPVEYYADDTESITNRTFRLALTETDADDRVRFAAESLARVISVTATQNADADAYAVKDKDTGYLHRGYSWEGGLPHLVESIEGGNGAGDIHLVTVHPEVQNLSIQCTHRGPAFTPNLFTALTAVPTLEPARLAWSAPGEPEAWPLLQSAIVGEDSRYIERIVALENSLLVWKEEGLYAVTGSIPNIFVDQVDVGLRLVRPDALATMGGVCFAWTNRGFMACTEAGVEQLATGTVADQLRLVSANFPIGASAGHISVWCEAHPRLGLVILSVSDGAADDVASRSQFVYHVRTQRWSTWDRDDWIMRWIPESDHLVASVFTGVANQTTNAWLLARERDDEDDATSYRDFELSGVTCSISGTAVTIATAAFGIFVPAAGDVISATGGSRRISSVSSGGGNYTITVASSGLSGTSCTWRQGYACTVEWQAQHLPGVGSRWDEMHAHLQLAASGYVSSFAASMGGYSERDTSAVTVSPTIAALNQAARQSSVVRVGMPRNIVRANHLYPYWQMRTAGVLWALAELDLHTDAVSQRVAR